LIVQQNYFSDLYPTKILDLSASLSKDWKSKSLNHLTLQIIS